jgi:hypothetical protein
MGSNYERLVKVGERIKEARLTLGLRKQKDFVDLLKESMPDINQPRLSEAEQGKNATWQERIVDYLIDECNIPSSFFETQLPKTTSQRLDDVEKRLNDLDENIAFIKALKKLSNELD